MSALQLCAIAVAAVAGARGTWSPCGLSMVSSINPFSEAARGHRYAVTCSWFVLGAVTGGLVLGAGTAVLGLVLGGLPPVVALWLGAVAALVGLAADLRLLRLPTHPRQVDEDWLRAYRPWVYGSGFGLQIGTGLATYVMTSATYLLVVLAALTGSVTTALTTGLVFGLVRGLAVLLGAAARTPAGLRAVHRRLDRLAPWSLAAAMAAQAAVAVVLGGVVAVAVAAVLVLLGLGRGRRAVLVREVLLEPAAELLGRERAAEPPALGAVATHR